jgi:monovalent cation:H+ antiporter, CPA1 family
LAVTENPAIPPEIKRQVGIVATGFVLFTLLVQGTTLRLLIGWLGLDRLSPLDRALSDQVVAVALQDVRETVAETVRSFDLTPAIIRDEAKRFGDRLNSSGGKADAAQDILDKDRVTLGMVALAGHERDLVLRLSRRVHFRPDGGTDAGRCRPADRGDADGGARRLSRAGAAGTETGADAGAGGLGA